MSTLAEAINAMRARIARNEAKLTEVDFGPADPADQREYDWLMDQVRDQKRQLAGMEQEARWPSV